MTQVTTFHIDANDDEALANFVRKEVKDSKFTADFKWCAENLILRGYDTEINKKLGYGFVNSFAAFLLNGTMQDPSHRDYKKFEQDFRHLYDDATDVQMGGLLRQLMAAAVNHDIATIERINGTKVHYPAKLANLDEILHPAI